MRKKSSARPAVFWAGLLCWMLLLTGHGAALDLDAPCTLTIQPGSEEFSEDLTQANLVLDVYWVAEATPLEGQDSYGFHMRSLYETLTVPNQEDTDSWRDLAQETAALALAEDIPLVAEALPGQSLDTELSPGLYLIVAHSQGQEAQRMTITDDQGQEWLVTQVNTQEYTYSFQPELVALPGKPVDDEGAMNTANPGQWIYDQTVTLKPEQTRRFGALEIVKTLQSYDTTGGAVTFVFSVDAVKDETTVYSDVVAMTFQAPGQKSILLDNIPVGAEVTVSEVYSGAGYRLVSPETRTSVIALDEIRQVTFENDYDNGQNKGHGLVNHFEYDPASGWQWQQLVDNTGG
jgi:hypothetical protein